MLLIQISYSDTVRIHSRRGSHSVTHSDLLFRYSMDTPQTRKSFYYSFRISSQIRSKHGSHSISHSDSTINFKFRYTLNTEVILSTSNIVQIRSRHGGPSISHSDSIINLKFRYALDTDAILTLKPTIWFPQCSLHGSHSTSHTDLNFRYSPDTLHTRFPFCHLF